MISQAPSPGAIAVTFPPEHDFTVVEFYSSTFPQWVEDHPEADVIVARVLHLPWTILLDLVKERRRESRSPGAPRRAVVILDRVFCSPAHDLPHLPPECVDAWITSIPFETMRHYGDDPRDLGNYQDREFVEKLVPVIAEWRRTLKPSGNLFLNFQPKMVGGFVSSAAWLLPQALVENGLRVVQVLSILKTNAMPENDPRLLKRSVEVVYHCVKGPEYVVFKDAIRRPSIWAARDHRTEKYAENGADPGNAICPALERLRRLSAREAISLLLGEGGDVLAIAKTQDQCRTHPARMADEVARWLTAYGSPEGGMVGDNFCGSGTSLRLAKALGRHYVGSDLSADYVAQAETALTEVTFGSLLIPGGSVAPALPAPSAAPVTTTLPGSRRRQPRQPVTKACVTCGKDFPPAKDWQKFCSRFCHDTYHNSHRRKHDQETDAR
jgi:DNA modification methylase/predicted nucleic acid-binding Zn ribbon protein